MAREEEPSSMQRDTERKKVWWVSGVAVEGGDKRQSRGEGWKVEGNAEVDWL